MGRTMKTSRCLGVARNFGLTRLWTQDNTVFWREQGFTIAPTDLLDKLPAAFGQPGGEWATLKLKDEVLSGLTQEQEFALFREAAREETEKAFRQARTLKGLAIVVAVLFALLAAVVGFYMMRYISYQKTHGGPPPHYR